MFRRERSDDRKYVCCSQATVGTNYIFWKKATNHANTYKIGVVIKSKSCLIFALNITSTKGQTVTYRTRPSTKPFIIFLRLACVCVNMSLSFHFLPLSPGTSLGFIPTGSCWIAFVANQLNICMTFFHNSVLLANEPTNQNNNHEGPCRETYCRYKE